MSTVDGWISKLKNLIEDFKLGDIFKTDETGFFTNKCLKERTASLAKNATTVNNLKNA